MKGALGLVIDEQAKTSLILYDNFLDAALVVLLKYYIWS